MSAPSCLFCDFPSILALLLELRTDTGDKTDMVSGFTEFTKKLVRDLKSQAEYFTFFTATRDNNPGSWIFLPSSQETEGKTFYILFRRNEGM